MTAARTSPRSRAAARAAAFLGLLLLGVPDARALLKVYLPLPNTYTTERTIPLMGMVKMEPWTNERDYVNVSVNGGEVTEIPLRDGWFFSGEIDLDDGANTIAVEDQTVRVMAGDEPKPPKGWSIQTGHTSTEDTCDACHAVDRNLTVTLLEAADTLCNWCHSDISSPKGKDTATIHSPVREGKCLSCHLPHAATAPALLKDERKKLCQGCHQAVFNEVATKPHVHGPLNVGDCSLCHAAHSSPGAGLLKESAATFCLTCHSLEEVFSSLPGVSSHPGIRDGKCRDCHNSHASVNPRLMKKIVNNLCVDCHPEKSHNFHEEKGFSIYICGRCHDVHHPESRKLIVNRSRELCDSCHAAMTTGQFVHEPLTKGNCFECHGFHGAPMGPRQVEVCGRCHSTSEAFTTAHPVAMPDGVRCTTCHSPHSSAKPKLTHLVAHRPFSEKKCQACHQADGSIAQGEAGVNGLCLTCHPEKKAPAAKQEGIILHKPFDNAACRSCHLSHNSANPFLLSIPPIELCGQCHSFVKKLKALAPASSHSAVMEGRCGDCHNSHLAANAKLLDRPPKELCLGCHGSLLDGIQVKHAPLENGLCSDCHQGHNSRFPKLLKDRELNLCKKCHAVMLRTIEASAPGKVVHGAVKKGQCGGCHGVHGGAGRELLKAGGNELCRPCHPTFKKPNHHRYGEDYLTYQDQALRGQQVLCNRCHRSHYSLNTALLIDRADPLCKQCHEI